MKKRVAMLGGLVLVVGIAGAGVTIFNGIAEERLSAERLSTPVTGHLEYSYIQVHMAMPVQLTVWSPTEEQAQTACKAAFRRIRELVEIFSDYDRDSELSRFCQRAGSGEVRVSEDLFAVLMRAQNLALQTDGAFDPTAGAAARLWREARAKRCLPETAEIVIAKNAIGFEKLKLNSARHSAELDSSGSRLDLGGIAKGYIGDQAILVLSQHGITAARYRAGGDIVLSGPPPDRAGWTVDLPQIVDQRLSNCGVSVSGD
ncbi:MAG: FAD:protein FMN transferase, partial [Planctomycetales bacterium]